MRRFREAVRDRDFVITVEPPLHTQLTRDSLRHSLDTLAGRIDGVQIGYSEDAEPHIAPLAIASIAMSRGVDPIICLSARDRNVSDCNIQAASHITAATREPRTTVHTRYAA